MTFDMVFIGTTSILPIGLSTNIYLEAELKKTIVKHGRRVFLLADSTKIGQPAVFNFFSFDNINVLVTDSMPDPDMLNILKNHDVQVVLA